MCRACLSPSFLTSFNLVSVHLMKLISSILISYNLCSRCNLCFFHFLLSLSLSFVSLSLTFLSSFVSSFLIWHFLFFFINLYACFFLFVSLSWFLYFMIFLSYILSCSSLFIWRWRPSGTWHFRGSRSTFQGCAFLHHQDYEYEAGVFCLLATCYVHLTVQYLWTNLICTFYIKNKTNFAHSLKMLYWARFSNTK